MPRTIQDNIRIGIYKKIMRDLHQKHPDSPYNRGLTFAFCILLKEGMNRFGEASKPSTPKSADMPIEDGFPLIAQHIELSEWFFDEKNYPTLKIAIRKVLQDIIYSKMPSGTFNRSTHQECIQNDLDNLVYWHTGSCNNYASIAMYTLLNHTSISKQYIDSVWLACEPPDLIKAQSVGHAVIIINPEPVNYDDRNYRLSEKAIIFDFWQGHVCLMSEYDFSPYPCAQLQYRANNSENPFKLHNFEERNRAHFERCNKAVNNFLTVIHERRRNNECIIPATADYCTRFQELANSSYAEFDPNDILDEKRANAINGSSKVAEALNVLGAFANNQTAISGNHLGNQKSPDF